MALADAVLQAHAKGDTVGMLGIAYLHCGSWEMGPLCEQLESLATAAWGARWEALLTDLRLHTTPLVRQGIPAAQAWLAHASEAL